MRREKSENAEAKEERAERCREVFEPIQTSEVLSCSLSFSRCEDQYPEKPSWPSWSQKAKLHQRVAKGPQPHQRNGMPRFLRVHVCLFSDWFNTSLTLGAPIMMKMKTSVGHGRRIERNGPCSIPGIAGMFRCGSPENSWSWGSLAVQNYRSGSQPPSETQREEKHFEPQFWTVIPSWVERGPACGLIFSSLKLRLIDEKSK